MKKDRFSLSRLFRSIVERETAIFRLPPPERGIIGQLLEKCGPQQVGVIRLPVPFGPKEFKERRNFLLPVYKLIRYQAYI
jgi:hypothetical protein